MIDNEKDEEITKITVLEDEKDTNEQKDSEPIEDILNQEIVVLKDKIKQISDAYKRILTEFDNYKRRTNETNKTVLFDGKKEVIEKLLSVMDSFEGAKKLIDDESVLKGLNLIESQLNNILTSYNVKKIDCLGSEFNPDFHNAVLSVEDNEKSGLITEIVKNGYMIDDKILRYAFVVVAK